MDAIISEYKKIDKENEKINNLLKNLPDSEQRKICEAVLFIKITIIVPAYRCNNLSCLPHVAEYPYRTTFGRQIQFD